MITNEKMVVIHLSKHRSGKLTKEDIFEICRDIDSEVDESKIVYDLEYEWIQYTAPNYEVAKNFAVTARCKGYSQYYAVQK